jgi:transposase InsO family protein
VTYTPVQKLATLRAYAASGMAMRAFCARQGLSTATLCAWRRAYERDRERGLEPRRNPRNRVGRTRRAYSPEERRAAVEAYGRSGLSRRAFCGLWGLSEGTLGKWLKVYRERGPKGLEQPFTTGARRRGPKRAPAAVRAEIAAVKRRFPHFGLRRVRDFLARFAAQRVSVPEVRRTLAEEGLASPPVTKRRRAPAKVRRFERARPGELWQSDITSYVLARHRQRVYLTVFLDDHSRYVVAWALSVHQRGELVTEALLEGIARFGKPREVLTDQGRQYFAWRGKSAFQKLLKREGIAHVVSRAHHPQTLGKCERLWKTIKDELWERARPADLDEARVRLGHFFAHYNHFRLHQGIGGLLPADRFFGAQSQAREAIERALSEGELELALGDPPRRPVFLYGQLGERQVTLHGERGKLVIVTPEGARQEIDVAALGAPSAREVSDDAEHGPGTEREQDAQGGAAQAPHALQERAPGAGAGARAVGGGERGRPQQGAPDHELDPRVLAGQGNQGGDGGGASGDAAAGVADEPERPGRYGLWTSQAAAQAAGEPGHDTGRSRERPQGAQAADRQARAPGEAAAGADRGAARAPGQPRGGEGPGRQGGARALPRSRQETRPGEQEAAGPEPEQWERGFEGPESEELTEPWWQPWWE